MVYDISGKLVATFFGSNVLKLPSKGAYVVKNKQMAEKVIVGTSIYSFERSHRRFLHSDTPVLYLPDIPHISM